MEVFELENFGHFFLSFFLGGGGGGASIGDAATIIKFPVEAY